MQMRKNIILFALFLSPVTATAAEVELEYCTNLLVNQIAAFEEYVATTESELVEVQCIKMKQGSYEMRLKSDCGFEPDAGITNTVAIAAYGSDKRCEAFHFRDNDCPEFVSGALLDQQNTVSGKDYASWRKIVKKECQSY
jgi:hypothetical protein